MSEHFEGFSAAAIRFLAELAQHDDRAWFEARREECERAVIAPARAFVAAIGPRLRELDPKVQAIARVGGSIKPLERRSRFGAKGSSLYKEYLDLWFWSGRRRAWDNSGFFVRLTPTRLTLAAGMIEFQRETLARYREQILDEQRGGALVAIVDDLRARGYVVGGQAYKRTPRPVPNDHPRAALARHGALFASFETEHPSELGTPAFVELALSHFAEMVSLHAWLLALRA